MDYSKAQPHPYANFTIQKPGISAETVFNVDYKETYVLVVINIGQVTTDVAFRIAGYSKINSGRLSPRILSAIGFDVERSNPAIQLDNIMN